MRKAKGVVLVMLMFGLLSGCASPLNSVQKREYQQYQASGIIVEEKNPGAGAALGILPGGGSFYVREYGFGVLNLLLWPASMLWDPISGYEGAMTINYAATKSVVDGKMRKEIKDLEEQLFQGLVTKEDYLRRKHDIESRSTVKSETAWWYNNP